MITNRFFFLLLSVLSFVSCTNEKDKERQELVEMQRRDSILAMIESFSDKPILFETVDSIIELPNDAELVTCKNSFLNMDGTVYNGKVNLKYSIRNDKRDLLLNRYGPDDLSIQNMLYILQIEIHDSYGHTLLINPDCTTILRFHPKDKLFACTYFYYDSLTKEYSTPVYFYENKTHNGNQSDTSGIPNREVDYEFWDTINNKNQKKVKHGVFEMTKQEVIGYEMTLKQFGFYYISRDDKRNDLQETEIAVQLAVGRKNSVDWHKVKVFLFTEQDDYNYYLGSTNMSDGRFEIKPSPHINVLQLPLGNTYTLLAYAIDGENCYFIKQRGIKLRKENLIEMKLPRVKFESLVKEIKNL
jgi:hypothetical protein